LPGKCRAACLNPGRSILQKFASDYLRKTTDRNLINVGTKLV